MPRIPTIDRNGRSKIAPQATAPRAAPGKFGSLGGTISDLGDALLHIEESVKKVAVLHQVTRATVAANQAIMETQDAALQDPDLDTNLPKYHAKIREVVEQSLSQVTDPMARMELQQQLSTRLTTIGFQLGVEARRTLGRKTVEALDLADQQGMEQIYRSPNEAMTQQEIALQAQRVNDAVAAGALSPIDGRKRVQEYNDNAREFSLTRQIEMDPEGALEVLQSGRHGLQNPKVAERLTTLATEKVAADVAQGKSLLRELQDTNELDAFKALTENKLTLSQLEFKEGRLDIRPKFRDALQANLNSTARFTTASDPEVFLDLLTQATRTSKWAMAKTRAQRQTLKRTGVEKPENDVQALMTNIINANTRGELAVADMKQLVGIVDADFQKAASSARHVWYNHILESVGTVMREGIYRAQPQLAAARSVQLSLQLMRRLEQGEFKDHEVDQEITQALRHEVRAQRPAMAMLEDLPDAVLDPRGFSPTASEPSKATAQYVFQNGKLVKVGAKAAVAPKASEE